MRCLLQVIKDKNTYLWSKSVAQQEEYKWNRLKPWISSSVWGNLYISWVDCNIRHKSSKINKQRKKLLKAAILKRITFLLDAVLMCLTDGSRLSHSDSVTVCINNTASPCDLLYQIREKNLHVTWKSMMFQKNPQPRTRKRNMQW